MKPADMDQDLSALEEELRVYERRYGLLTQDFYEAYMDDEMPATGVPDHADWARLYEDWLRWQTRIAADT